MEMESELFSLREELNKLLENEEISSPEVYHASIKLDVLITNYYRRKASDDS